MIAQTSKIAFLFETHSVVVVLVAVSGTHNSLVCGTSWDEFLEDRMWHKWRQWHRVVISTAQLLVDAAQTNLRRSMSHLIALTKDEVQHNIQNCVVKPGL